MGKQGNNNKNKSNNNYFTRAAQQGGKDFIETTNIEQLQRDAVKIFRDLAANRIDVQRCQEYLTNDRLAGVLEQQAYITSIYNTEIYNSIDYRIRGMEWNHQIVSSYLMSLRDEWACREAVYQIIYSKLQEFKVTKDVNVILSMIYEIRKNRWYI
jgi:hypothetical protein